MMSLSMGITLPLLSFLRPPFLSMISMKKYPNMPKMMNTNRMMIFELMQMRVLQAKEMMNPTDSQRR